MARRRRVYHKPDRRDPKFDSELIGHLISKVMKDGKRSLAERIVYAAIDKANEGTDTVDPLEVVTRAIENAKPRVEVKSRRVGGATYQVPLEVAAERIPISRFRIACRLRPWFLNLRTRHQRFQSHACGRDAGRIRRPGG